MKDRQTKRVSLKAADLQPTHEASAVPEPTERFVLLSLDTLNTAAGTVTTTPIIDTLWPDGSLVFLGGPAKAGKSSYALEEALCLAMGWPVLGHYPVPAAKRVLFIEEEDEAAKVNERARALIRQHGADPDALAGHPGIHFLIQQGFKMDNETDLDSLRRTIGEHQIDVIYQRKLFKAIPEPYWSLCRVGLYTGCRKSELLAARWDLIDWGRRILTLPTSKSGKPRFVELGSNVLDTLRKIPGRGEQPLIFPGCRKVSHCFPGWAEEAKLLGKVTFHTLRHTFASRLVMAGVDLLTVKALGGWNRLEMVERYSHLAPAHKRAAVGRLAQSDPLRTSDSANGTYTGTSPSEVKAGCEATTA